MNLVATVLGVLIICLMVIFGGNHLVTILSGNLSSGQTQDLTALAFFFLAGIYIAWRLIKLAVYHLFFTATKAIYDAKSKNKEKN